MVSTITEIWKDIPDFENYYQVSNFGRVRGLARKDNLGRRINSRLFGVSNATVSRIVNKTRWKE